MSNPQNRAHPPPCHLAPLYRLWDARSVLHFNHDFPVCNLILKQFSSLRISDSVPRDVSTLWHVLCYRCVTLYVLKCAVQLLQCNYCSAVFVVQLFQWNCCIEMCNCVGALYEITYSDNFNCIVYLIIVTICVHLLHDLLALCDLHALYDSHALCVLSRVGNIASRLIVAYHNVKGRQILCTSNHDLLAGDSSPASLTSATASNQPSHKPQIFSVAWSAFKHRPLFAKVSTSDI